MTNQVNTLETKALHTKAVEIAKRFHDAESELIDILQTLDEKRVFIHLGYSSLFDYAVKALKLSEANSSNFITVARKSKTVPELKMAIRLGDITVSKARKITPVLTKENSSHWLELAKTLPKFKLEKEVAKVQPQTITPERAKYVTETRLELKLGVSEDLMKKLRRAQDLTSQKTRRPATLEGTLEALIENYLKKHDPVKKAERNNQSAEGNNHRFERNIQRIDGNNQLQKDGFNNNAAASVPGTRYISAQQKHQVNLRDQGRCAHVNESGHRCESQRWVEIHHIKALSLNGTNDTHNLQTLCHGHHKQKHLYQ